MGNYHHYSGVLHVHTTESDGTKTLEEVVAIGRQVGLDFIMFTDHMNLTNRDRGKEGMYGNLLAVVGYEHNDLDDNNHYLIFDSPGVYPKDAAVSDYVRVAAADNALGIIAHPDEIRDRMGKYPPYPWTDWSVDGYQGIELWNQMSEWMEKLTPSNKLLMAFSPRKSMVGPTERVLRLWDEISLRRKCAGIASVDAHAFPIKVGPLTVEIFPYKVHFRSLRTYIVLREPMAQDFETARAQLYTAIRECRLYLANLRWGDAAEFQFIAERGGEIITAGERFNSHEGVTLKVSLPAQAEIRMIHNGRTVREALTDHLIYRVVNPGLYRVEAWKGSRGWIFSNHIRVGV
ncbi:histidinol-phosphatase [candidate division GN15 bacterium]|uniref:Histidinol-phosphatase n=1 Tax=candidate division GN15 bacterium TaxID=2072418 RepID=A0A855X5J1_9BACT|nr:MAG: histidinol-phosphatase [candidate division GN15 bacterium]